MVIITNNFDRSELVMIKSALKRDIVQSKKLGYFAVDNKIKLLEKIEQIIFK